MPATGLNFAPPVTPRGTPEQLEGPAPCCAAYAVPHMPAGTRLVIFMLRFANKGTCLEVQSTSFCTAAKAAAAKICKPLAVLAAPDERPICTTTCSVFKCMLSEAQCTTFQGCHPVGARNRLLHRTMHHVSR